MRRILITSRIDELAQKYDELLHGRTQFEHNGTYFEPIKRIENLWREFGNSGTVIMERRKDEGEIYVETEPTDRQNLTIYLYNLYSRLDAGIASRHPSVLLKEAYGLEKILNQDGLKREFSINGRGYRPLKDIINDQLQYPMVRKWIFPEYASKIGFKTCVYCNSQYAVTDEHERGYYQLDHWLPQSKYPYLSICFFNLYPCCGSCNRMKNDDDENNYACIYAEKESEEREVYRFTIETGSLARYILTHDVNQLKIDFDPADETDVITPLKDKMHIDDLYQQFKDTAEDVVWKRMAYDRGYKEALCKARLDFISNQDVKRFILGMYDGPEDVHKRPLTKLIQDVAKQLGVI